MIVHNAQNYWDFGVSSLSSIIKSKKHKDSETGSVFQFLEYWTMEKLQNPSNSEYWNMFVQVTITQYKNNLWTSSLDQ